MGQFWEHKDVVEFDNTITRMMLMGYKVIAADFSRISFISSQALGRMVNAYSKMKESGGYFILVNPVGSVKETIGIAGFADFMKICPAREQLDAFIDSLPAP